MFRCPGDQARFVRFHYEIFRGRSNYDLAAYDYEQVRMLVGMGVRGAAPAGFDIGYRSVYYASAFPE